MGELSNERVVGRRVALSLMVEYVCEWRCKLWVCDGQTVKDAYQGPPTCMGKLAMKPKRSHEPTFMKAVRIVEK